MGRKVDVDPDMIWCPSAKCDTALRRENNEQRLVCPKCGTNACFRCQKPWHEGLCDNDGVVGLWGFFFRKDVRKCPGCKVRIEKNGGCPHMSCYRCHYNFCWCCMGNYATHNRWYSLCPGLPFSICLNIMIVILLMAL